MKNKENARSILISDSEKNFREIWKTESEEEAQEIIAFLKTKKYLNINNLFFKIEKIK